MMNTMQYYMLLNVCIFLKKKEKVFQFNLLKLRDSVAIFTSTRINLIYRQKFHIRF